MNFKKLLAMLLVVSMLAVVFASCEPTDDTSKDTSAGTSSTGDASADTSSDDVSAAPAKPIAEMTDQEIYDLVLGDFYTTYQAALAAKDVSEKFALQAIAEAKLLESGVMLPTTSNGGNYAISRVVPYTVSPILWGNDGYRLYQTLATTEFIAAADRTELKKLYKDAKDAAAYFDAAKKYLTEKGYTLATAYNKGYSSDPTTWDVFSTYQQADTEPIVNTFDGLVEYDVKNTIKPALAESWTSKVNDDGTQTVTFKIRKGAKWVTNQGQEYAEVKADDWVAALQHLLDAQGGLEYLVDGLIVNAHEYMAEECEFKDVGVKALDDYTLEYTLTGETTYFMTMLGYSPFAPLNRTFFESKGGKFGVAEFAAAKESGYTYGTSHTNILYNGPYVISNATAENSITFKANELYWNKDAVANKEMNWVFIDPTGDNTKSYKEAKAGTIAGAGLNPSTVASAKADGLFDKYAYVSSTDATAFSAFFNVNRKAYANFDDASVAKSTLTDEQKARALEAMANVHFRRALCHSVDRATMNAAMNGEDIKTNNLINGYVPGDFVQLEKDVTVKINGKDTTFKAGTNYGAIVQAQLDADGMKIKAYDPKGGELGTGSSAGYDGWWNKEAAAAEIKLAVDELKAKGIEINKENPIVIDYACLDREEYKNQAMIYEKCIEEATDGLVQVNLVICPDRKSYYNATYYFEKGEDANYHINTFSGWGPDYGDPKTYLDTMIPGTGGMAKSIGLF